MLLVMMVAFFQVQYIVTSDAIIISNFILKTDSILCQFSRRSPSRHDAHYYKDNPNEPEPLSRVASRSGGQAPCHSQKRFFLSKEISVHHLRLVLTKSSLSFQISKIHQYYNEKLQVRLDSAKVIEARNETFPFFWSLTRFTWASDLDQTIAGRCCIISIRQEECVYYQAAPLLEFESTYAMKYLGTNLLFLFFLFFLFDKSERSTKCFQTISRVREFSCKLRVSKVLLVFQDKKKQTNNPSQEIPLANSLLRSQVNQRLKFSSAHIKIIVTSYNYS